MRKLFPKTELQRNNSNFSFKESKGGRETESHKDNVSVVVVLNVILASYLYTYYIAINGRKFSHVASKPIAS